MVAASLGLMTVGAGGYYVVIVGLKLVALDFDELRWVPSMAYSATVFGMGLGGIWIGRWSDRIGVGTPALIGAVMVSAGALTASFVVNLWAFLLAHGVMMGLLGNAALFSPLIANTARWFDQRRGVAVALVTSAQGLAGIVWPAVFRFTIASWGWRETYRVYAGVALVSMVPLSLLLRRRAPVVAVPYRSQGVSNARVFGLSGGVALGLLCLAIVGCCVAMAMPIVHVVAHTSDLGHPLSRGAEVLMVALGCAFLGRIAWGFVADRIGGLRVLILGSAFQAVTLSLYLFVESLAGLYVVSGLFGIAFGGIIPSYTLVVSRYFPREGLGWRVAVVYLFGALGMAVGSWLGGAFFDLYGSYRGAFAMGLLFNVMNLGIVGLLLMREAANQYPAGEGPRRTAPA